MVNFIRENFMSEVSTPVEKSTWASKFSALGPGIVMASAAVGGSHIIASTQAVRSMVGISEYCYSC